MFKAAGTGPIYTIGHSTRTIEAFVELLQTGGVRRVIDVRSIPRSRTNPQYNLDVLGEVLAAWQIGYSPIPELGGRRGLQKTVAPEVNGFWKNERSRCSTPSGRRGVRIMLAVSLVYLATLLPFFLMARLFSDSPAIRRAKILCARLCSSLEDRTGLAAEAGMGYSFRKTEIVRPASRICQGFVGLPFHGTVRALTRSSQHEDHRPKTLAVGRRRRPRRPRGLRPGAQPNGE